MEKLQFCSGLSGRRGFLRNCVLLGAGAWACSVLPAAAARPAQAKGKFVVVNGWVLPSGYFRDGQP